MKKLLFLPLYIVSFALNAGPIPTGVDWYQGTVEKAFKEAREQNKHLFLYWGAIWCPPCNHIKKKVFSSPEFQKEVKNFLAIYLDGDTDRAQIWGEKLKASGYPTMLVMTPQGKEVMRFPTSVDAKKYTQLLKDSLKRKTSISELIKKKKPTDSEWSQLAFYSWGQNQEISDKLNLFEQLYYRVPQRLVEERAALLLNFIGTLLREKEVKRDKETLGKEFISLISKKDLAIKFANTLSYSGGKYIDFLFDKVEERVQHHIKLKKLMSELSIDQDLTIEERLFTFAYEMNIVIEDEKLLPDFQKRLLAKVKQTDSEAKDSYSRQDAMSTAIWMLQQSKLYREAKEYGERELKKSIAPYYFMSYLASIEKEMGNIDGYLEWKRKAWQSAKGGSTRFQWGTSYLTGMIEENKKKNFGKDFKVILGELLKQPDAFSGRNKKRLERLQKALSELKDKTFNLRVKAVIMEECSKLKDGKSCHNSFKNLNLI